MFYIEICRDCVYNMHSVKTNYNKYGLECNFKRNNSSTLNIDSRPNIFNGRISKFVEINKE